MYIFGRIFFLNFELNYIIFSGLFAAFITMPVVLCEPTEKASVDNLIGDNQDADKFKEIMFSNDRVSKHLEEILPWFYYRGVFER